MTDCSFEVNFRAPKITENEKQKESHVQVPETKKVDSLINEVIIDVGRYDDGRSRGINSRQ